MNRRRNLIILAAGLIAIVVIGVFAVRPKDNAIEATVATVGYSEFTTRLPESGTVEKPRLETLAALVAGNIGRILVKPGDHVEAGQLLVQLENPQIVNALTTAQATYDAAQGRALSAAQTNAVLPAQNRSAVQQAQYNLEQARFALSQAITDQKNGVQTGLGFGSSTAESERVAAESALANAQTQLREQQRLFDADQDLFANKAISKDALDKQQAALEQAKVSADQARRNLADTQNQLRQNVGVLADRDHVQQAQAALAAALQQAGENKAGDVEAARGDAAARLSDLVFARQQAGRLSITAPFAGTVQTVASETGDALRPLQPGDNVAAGTQLNTLAGDEGFVVRTRVDEQDIRQVRVGQVARISGEDLGTNVLPGRVIAVGAVALKSDDPSNTSRQVLTTIRLDHAPAYLRDGMTVDVDIVTTSLPHVIVLPNDAIRHDGPKPYVYVVRASDKHAVKRTIALGAKNDAQTVVTSGLSAGDRVVIDNNAGITENVAVKPAPTPSPSPAAAGGPA
jgi:RND family efflux transporter MFP subunit